MNYPYVFFDAFRYAYTQSRPAGHEADFMRNAYESMFGQGSYDRDSQSRYRGSNILDAFEFVGGPMDGTFCCFDNPPAYIKVVMTSGAAVTYNFVDRKYRLAPDGWEFRALAWRDRRPLDLFSSSAT